MPSSKKQLPPTKPETTLADFQAAMAHAVMRPLGPGDRMRRENRAVANDLIKPNDRLTSPDRLQIYNQQYWWRLLSGFSDDFRGLRAVLGQRKFDKLAIAYLHECGSHSWNLRDLGSRLGQFLTGHPETITPHGMLATEMAAVEWARVIAFDGEQRPKLDAEEFVTRQPESMVLDVQPYISLLELRYPIDSLLKRLKHAENAPASNAVSRNTTPRPLRLAAKPLQSPLHLAVHRSNLSVFYKRIEPEAFHLLKELRDGVSLEEACGIAFAASFDPAEVIAEKVRNWFAAWMSFGWLCERTPEA
ncbi:DNA-binding domain-containing protein [Luteolibacter sp. LG18]|uniref:HvfC/BufC N-terminal domain-containing protein n=1 Tax=Luteolibacter sp. LG18 TaxID=2819286 RepID=UPI002B2FB1DA|nr:hypothetical protein llg_11280 [Luteolibacter sp. LG18]